MIFTSRRLGPDWELWIGKKLDAEASVEHIVHLLVSAGFDAAFAFAEVQRVMLKHVRDRYLNAQRIFVSVANYRDSETQHTISDLLTQASFPDRVVFGVLSQVSLPTDTDCLAPEVPQVRQTVVRAEDSRGACWARSRILTEMRQGEPYVMQIDSHTRAVPGWDEKVLTMLQNCPSNRALLSCYPCAYTPPRSLDVPMICWCVPKRFNGSGIIELESHTCSYGDRPAQPIATPFVAGGFLFGPAAAFDEVPYDPNLYFQGEEVAYSLRLWTHGWDVFAPNDVLFYHDYSVRRRAKHWEDHTDWGLLEQQTAQRMQRLVEGAQDTFAERYWNGSVRSVQEFEYYAGVNFARREIREPRKTQFEWPPVLPLI